MEQLSGGDALHTSIARELPGADTETVTVVTSMAGLLGAVAYADRNYSANEARDRDRQHWLPPTTRNPPPFRDLVTVRLPRLCAKWRNRKAQRGSDRDCLSLAIPRRCRSKSRLAKGFSLGHEPVQFPAPPLYVSRGSWLAGDAPAPGTGGGAP